MILVLLVLLLLLGCGGSFWWYWTDIYCAGRAGLGPAMGLFALLVIFFLFPDRFHYYR